MELNTDLTISTSTTDYRGDIMISTQDLSIAANREVVQFKTDLTISAYSDGTLKSEMKTCLCFSNNTMLFSIIDYAEVRKSILYFSKFFNTNFEEAYLWNILAQGTSEQINKSHLADVYTAINNVAARLNNFLEGTDADDIINTWKELQDFLKGISGVQDLYTLIRSMVTLDNLLPILKDHFIRKDQDDTTAYNITFANTADEGGNGITLGDKFVPDSYGGRLNAYYDSNHTLQTKLEVDYLKVRKKATFTELTIEELKSVGGSIILSPAAMKCSLVDTRTILQEDIDKITQSNMYYDSETQTYKPYCAIGDIVFRCYFTDEDEDGTKIYNQFVAGDQARCQTFNVSEIKDYTGTADSTGSRYYWRLVVNVGENYIDLSQNDKDDLSDVPVVGDNIVQFGHRYDPTRQAAQVLSAYGTTAPSHIMYQGVGSTMQFPSTVEGEQDIVSGPYSLYGKDVYGLYYNVDSTTPQNSKMNQYTYGDWYVGTRDQNHRHDNVTYVKFDSETKQLTLRGIMIQSQYGDTQPIKFYRGVYDDKATYYYMDYVTYTDENGVTGTYLHTGKAHTTGVKPTDTEYWTPEAKGTTGTPGEPAYAAYIDNPNDSIMVGSDSILSSGVTVTTYTGVSIPYGTELLELVNYASEVPSEVQNIIQVSGVSYVQADKEYRFTILTKGDGKTALDSSYKIKLTVTGNSPDGSKQITRSAFYTLMFINKGTDGETIQIVPSTTEVKYYTNATNPYFSPSAVTCKVMRKIGTQSYSECTLPNVILYYTIDENLGPYKYTGQTLIPSSSASDITHFTDRVDFTLYYDNVIIGSQPVTILSDGAKGSDGDSSITIYKNSSTKPDTPTSGTEIPNGWRLTTLAEGTYSMGVDTSQTISGKYTKSFSLGKGTEDYASYYKIAGLSGIHNTMQCVKLVFKGNTLSSYTVKIDSYTSSEASYDILYVGKLDSSPSTSSYTQSTSGIGKSNTCSFTITDTKTHFVYIYYVKDASTTAGEDAVYFKITFPDTIVEEGTLYSCHGTKDGKTGIYTWEEPQVSIYGNDPVYSYWGDWDENSIYRGNSEIRDIVSIPIKNSDGAITGRTFYRARIDAGNIPVGVSPESSTGLNYWMKIPQYSSIATDLLLASQAIIERATVRQLLTADNPNARIHIRENILSLYDSSNKERLQIIGDNLSDTGTLSTYGFASFYINDGLVANSGGPSVSKSVGKIQTVASFSVFSDGTSVTVPTITLSCDSSTDYNGWAGNITLSIWIKSSDGSTIIASKEKQGIETSGSISLTGASYTLDAGDYNIIVGLQGSIGVNYDPDNPYSQSISFTAEADYSGTISVGIASASDNKISIGANGMIINLGNDFAVQMIKTDTDGSKIVFLGSNGGSTIGFRITSSGVQYNQGSGWVTLSNSGGSSGGSGTVTSVGMSVPTGFSVSPATITTSGKFILSFASGYSLPTTSKQVNWNSAYNAMHSHSNKTALDSITSDKITAWDEATSERYCAPRLTMISGVIDGTMTKTLKVEHPYYGTGKGEVILMVHSKKNGGRPAQTASYSGYTGRRSKKGWCEARGTGNTPFTQTAGSIDAYNALPLFILQHYVRRNGYTTSTMTMESWRSLSHAAKNTYEGFDGDRSNTSTTAVHSVKHKRFGIAIRWENPEFTALVDSSKTLSAHTMIIGGKKRYLYSAVAPIECYLDCGEIVFGVVTPGVGV